MILDWSDRSHWDSRLLPCIYCTRPTNLRDDNGQASHKTCAEQTLMHQQDDQHQDIQDRRYIA